MHPYRRFLPARKDLLNACGNITRNNLRKITLGIRPTWNVNSLTFMLSCSQQ